MSAQRRKLIQEYLVENFRRHGNYSSISVGEAPSYLPEFRDPEMKRYIFLERDKRFLIAVHSDAGFKDGLDGFDTLMKFMTTKDIATISVFDDHSFYNWDKGPFKSSRRGGSEEVRKRIKLLGLERMAQKLGSLTYFKNHMECLEVVRFTAGVVADYSQSNNDFARERIRERELLTVMDAEVVRRLDDFELLNMGLVHRIKIAGFDPYAPPREVRERPEAVPDERTQYLLAELDRGNEDIVGYMNWQDIEAVRKFGRNV